LRPSGFSFFREKLEASITAGAAGEKLTPPLPMSRSVAPETANAIDYFDFVTKSEQAGGLKRALRFIIQSHRKLRGDNLALCRAFPK